MSSRGYAQGTSVPVDRTRNEIDRLLEKHGATGFIYGNTAGSALVAFEMRERRIRFIHAYPVNTPNVT